MRAAFCKFMQILGVSSPRLCCGVVIPEAEALAARFATHLDTCRMGIYTEAAYAAFSKVSHSEYSLIFLIK